MNTAHDISSVAQAQSNCSIRVKIALIAFCSLLTACGKSLDSERIAQAIQQDVIKQGGVSLKSVTCPQGVKPEAGKTFECVGEIDTGYTFTIAVKQQDDRGTVIWDVPNAKGLINLVKFESLVQAAVASEIGSRPVIRCGGMYKAARPGQTFDCQVEAKVAPPKPIKGLKTVAVKSSKPDKIAVTVDSESNINWQRIVPSLAVKPPTKGKQTTANSKQATADQADSNTAKAVPAKGSAEDFRSTIGSSDSFED